MLDIKFIRDNLEVVKKSIDERTPDPQKKELAFTQLKSLLADYEKKLDLQREVDELRAKRNVAAKNRDIEEGTKIKNELNYKEKDLEVITKRMTELQYEVPGNIPLDDVPSGDESNNQIVRSEGEIPKYDFKIKDHVELGEELDILDIPHAAKVSGSRFAYLKNEGVFLELALVHYAMKKLSEKGFSPIIPPALIKNEMTKGLGYWHSGGNNNYYLVVDYEEDSETQKTENPLYLVGTGEHSVVPMHSDEILKDSELPKKYAAFSPCFRREVGTYGKDVRGILRVHQFEKVEMVAFTKPEDAEAEFELMLNMAEGFLKDFKLPYRVVKLAKGDLSFPAAKTIDLETWIPSQNIYRETHSISTTTDFQARRLKTKYRREDGSTEYVHILNGTALALGRILIAILENYQQADGSVKVPEVLIPYTGFSEITPKK